MDNQEHGGSGSLLIAFLAGAAVGAAFALLFAPSSGQQAREYLGQRAREGRQRAAEAARQGREAIERQRESLSSTFERAREQYQGSPSRSQEPDA